VLKLESQYRLRIVKDVQYIRCCWIKIYHFTVINASIATYPQNYIVNLPKENVPKSKTFTQAFPDVDRVQFALSLLKEALNNPDYVNDPDIKAEILAN
jgi:hypothetical protein